MIAFASTDTTSSYGHPKFSETTYSTIVFYVVVESGTSDEKEEQQNTPNTFFSKTVASAGIGSGIHRPRPAQPQAGYG